MIFRLLNCMNFRLIVFFLFIFNIHLDGYSQLFGKKTVNISQCEGIINVSESGTYLLQFIGIEESENGSFINYLKDSVSSNLIWSYYNPKQKGEIKISLSVDQQKAAILIFETSKKHICNDIKQGKAKALYNNSSITNNSTEEFVFECNKEKSYVFVFIGESKASNKINFDFEFIPTDENGNEIIDEKIVDFTYGKDINNTLIKIINSKTHKPVTANLMIIGSKSISGYYQASDLYIPILKRTKALVKVDCKGFFSKDIEHRFLDSQKDTILVDLDPLTVGASIQFEEIEFYRGTSTIKKKSEKKVKRLADFLALNAIVKIEIQGHVNAKGKNTPSNVRLSKKRAKRVLKKLIQNGIDKNRLTAVGLGNSAPVYPKPKHSYEEQANRRVEIMIK